MKSIVELINELAPITPFLFAQRFDPADINMGTGQRIDFDYWLRNCMEPRRQFAGLEDAYGAYIKSFGSVC
jgi:hypothetical protein